jgi:hypothetical protein
LQGGAGEGKAACDDGSEDVDETNEQVDSDGAGDVTYSNIGILGLPEVLQVDAKGLDGALDRLCSGFEDVFNEDVNGGIAGDGIADCGGVGSATILYLFTD